MLASCSGSATSTGTRHAAERHTACMPDQGWWGIVQSDGRPGESRHLLGSRSSRGAGLRARPTSVCASPVGRAARPSAPAL